MLGGNYINLHVHVPVVILINSLESSSQVKNFKKITKRLSL